MQLQKEIEIAKQAIDSSMLVPPRAEIIADLYQLGSHFDWTFFAEFYQAESSIICVYARTEMEWPLIHDGVSVIETFVNATMKPYKHGGKGRVICGVKHWESQEFTSSIRLIADMMDSSLTSRLEYTRNGITLDGQFHQFRIHRTNAPMLSISWYDYPNDFPILLQYCRTFVFSIIEKLQQNG